MSPRPESMIVTITVADLEALLDRKLATIASPSLPRFLTVAQCAAWLDCTAQAVNKWCREEGMPFVQLGSERRFEPAHVVQWMRSRGKPLDLPAPGAPRHLRAIRKGG